MHEAFDVKRTIILLTLSKALDVFSRKMECRTVVLVCVLPITRMPEQSLSSLCT